MLFSDLPPEIQDEIFEWAAYMHAEDCFTLSLISKRVQARVEKVMYESLYLFRWDLAFPPPRTDKVAPLSYFLFTIQNRPAHFFATHVRNIYFQPNTSHNDAKLVLEKCSGLQHLGLFISPPHFSKPNLATWIYPFANTLQSLMTTRNVLKGMTESGIVFPRINYLAISMFPRYMSLATLAECLPALTIVEMFLDETPSGEHPWDKDAEVLLSSTSNLQFLGLHTHKTCVDIVKRWKETIVSPVRIAIRRYRRYHDPFPAKWQRLTTGAFDSLL